MEYKIEKECGVIKAGLLSQLKLTVVSWGSNAPKYDLRNWNKDRPLNGVTFDDAEIASLKMILDKYLSADHKEPEKKPEPKVSAPEKPKAKKKKDDSIVNTLTTVPVNDCNYVTALNQATKEQLDKAIKIMEKNGGKNKTRIKRCKEKLHSVNSTKRVVEEKPNLEKNEPKKKKATVIQFPTKKPEFETLDPVDEKHTYEECEAKLSKEREIFKDADSQFVIDGLLQKCKEDDNFRNNVMREDKTYLGAFEYFYNLAKDGFAIKINNNMAYLDNEMALEYAINYFNKKG